MKTASVAGGAVIELGRGVFICWRRWENPLRKRRVGGGGEGSAPRTASKMVRVWWRAPNGILEKVRIDIWKKRKEIWGWAAPLGQSGFRREPRGGAGGLVGGGARGRSVTWASNMLSLSTRFKDTIVNAKYGGHTEAVRRLLGQLPISAQSYSSSPYLDLSLFSYDDKWVSVMERPKTCGDHPIRWVRRARQQ